MVKVLSLSPDALPNDQMDKLVSTLCPPEGQEKYLEFSRTDDGGLEIYVEDGWINEIKKPEIEI